ncbi:lantibiotic dehydratase [Larkinella soli]|uniref:lantibiotic dehydratase n=1 Tax=Larkinella soli TaxID=1770527 RepID=UPI000FFC7C39|nr:lantibiotic dehydratase [Larkinella soli]
MATTPFQTAFVRVPLAPWSRLEALDLTTLADRLRDPAFREALYIASPALYAEAVALDFSREPDEKSRRVVYALVKYLSRYSARCTPFGRFSGFSTLPIAPGPTQVRLTTDGTVRKVTRLDMNYLCALAQDLEKHPAIRPFLRFYPNSSLYAVRDHYRYIAYRYDSAGLRKHHLLRADRTDYLDGVLDKAKPGATVVQLAESLVDAEITREEADAFVGQLLDAQLLVSELEPALTGDDFLLQILTTLKTVQENHPSDELGSLLNLMKEIRTDLKALETADPSECPGNYRNIEEKLRRMTTPFDRKVLFQIDTWLPGTEGGLSQGLINKLISKIPALMKLVPAGNAVMEAFKARFLDRYEQEEIPLVVALDPELGIGYPAGQPGSDLSPLVEGLETGTPELTDTFTVPAEHRLLFQKIAEAQVPGEYEICLREDDLRTLEPAPVDLPPTHSAMFSVFREGGREKLILNAFGGQNGSYLLGRFGHTDPSVPALLQEISRAEDEENPGVLFADLVHLPEARTGNVIIRPRLKTYQIPFLGKASAEPEHQIPVTDLMVSVRANTVRLRSRSLNRIIVPRLSNAHHFSQANALDIYHFLCDLQAQHQRTSLSYLLGPAVEIFSFIPRISLDTLLLSEARWNFRDTQVKDLVAAFKTGSWSGLREEIDRWRSRFRIPRHLCLVEGDNELYVDLENRLLAETFVHEIKSRPRFTVREFLYRDETAVVESGAGRHLNQFVVAFRNGQEPAGTERARPEIQTVPTVTRKFMPGSEWLYVKLYSGIKTADTLLTDVLLPLTEQLEAEGRITRYFFIRYADPDAHLRFRFHLTDPAETGPVMSRLYTALNPLLAERTVTSVQTDTYHREVERYGETAMEIAESFFHIDSRTILHFLTRIEGAEGEEYRWRFGLKLIHDLLDRMDMSLKDRIELTGQQARFFGKEFGYNADRKKQLDHRFKAVEGVIQDLLDETGEEHQFLYDLSRARSEHLRRPAEAVQSLRRSGRFGLSLEDWLASQIHMTVNRLFRTRQRVVEYALYYHLHKAYRIRYGRQVLSQPPAEETVFSISLSNP